ncbi:MAG: hypothetical protein IJJ56_06960 [Prevotella sp.]|nr:hypothetical protein [Prevotella sp.]
MEFIGAIIFSIIFLGVWYGVQDYFEQKSNEKYAKQELERWEANEKKKKKSKGALDSLYGKCTRALCLDENNNYTVRVFESSQTIVIGDKPYKFDEITGCEASTMPKESVPVSAITTTDKGNMAVRAAVGGALLGPVGALAGAVTAKKNTKIDKEEEARRFEQAMHDNMYRTGGVTMYVKSISKPTVFIPCFKSDEKELCAVINAIVAATQSNK